MIRYLTLVLLICIQSSIVAQSYTVIHSIGEIYNLQTGKYLQKGMKIDETAALRFDSQNARAAVLSSSRGRYIIQETSSSTSQSDAAYTLSSIISPARGKLSTRSGGINNALDFKKHFEDGPIAVFDMRYILNISPSAFPMNEDKFFYTQYNYEGELINKKLSNNEASLIFDGTIYSIDDQPVDPENVGEMTLFYYNNTTQVSSQITKIQLAHVSNEDLISISSNFEQPTSEENLLTISEWVNDLYGKCTAEQVAEALSRVGKK